MSENRLIASGLLYEGSDFEAWLETLRPSLEYHFPSIRIVRRFTLYYVVFIDRAARTDVATILWWQVSPCVQSRVPESHRRNPAGLLHALFMTARPFRFMELPAELRQVVYHHVFPSKSCLRSRYLHDRICGRNLPEHNNDLKAEHPLLSADRQIRNEALPLLYKSLTFHLMCHDRVTSRTARARNKFGTVNYRLAARLSNRKMPTNIERITEIHDWTSRFAQNRLRLLRNVSVQLPSPDICSTTGREDVLHCSLIPSGGKLELRVDDHDWIKPDSQQLLRDHAATTSKLAQALKLEGEALIMFFTSRPEIWDRLELSDVQD